MARIAGIFLAGILGLLPLIVTAAVIGWVASFAYAYFGPESWFGTAMVSLGLSISATAVTPYVVGLLIVIGAIFLVGLLVEHRIGSWIGVAVDAVVRRIPLVSNVYDLSKRFTSIMGPKIGDELKGMSPVWCFFGGEGGACVLALLASPTPIAIGGASCLGVLIPSAPVPFGGALIYVPEAWIKPAAGGVEHLMNVYVSMGVTPPKEANPRV
jgi:uncharacterized membrane protein